MHTDSRSREAHARERGFTLIELLLVVAMLGMLASIAIPELRNALYMTKRNAAIAELRLLRDELQKFKADTGAYPAWGALDFRTLSPLTPRYIPRSDLVLQHIQGRQLSNYIPWNVIDEPFDAGVFVRPKSFYLEAQLAYDPGTWLYMTDAGFYVWKDGALETISEKLN